MEENYVRGNSVLIEITIDKNQPFEEGKLDDPENGVTITIINQKGSIIVNNQPMLSLNTGKYYYILQTTSAFVLGRYECTITISGDFYDALYTTKKMFYLTSNNDGSNTDPSSFLLRDAVLK
jgi:hypothetical protein